MKTVTVKQLVEYFGYKQICGDESSINRVIHDMDVNRPGLELAGYHTEHVYRRIVILGQKEIGYIKLMSQQAQEEAFDYLTQDDIPMILISRDMECPKILLEIAEKKNFPIFSSFASTSSLMVEICSYLEGFFATVETMHGVLLSVYGKGVLITGDSGIGKSEVALELIKKGHLLVADDRVDVYREHNHLTGEAPEILKNMLEIRGVGIIEVTSMFGITSTIDKKSVDYIIDLKRWDQGIEYDRIGANEDYVTISGIDVPKITIPVSEGRSVSTIIEAAVSNFLLKDKGINSSEILEQRVVDLINNQKEEN